MSLNPAIDYLLTKKSIALLCFGRQLTNTNVLLYGPGQLDSNGVPMPCLGILRRLTVYDSSTLQSTDAEVEFSAGDLISVQAEFGTTTYTITVLKNNAATALSISGVAGYSAVWATILISLLDPVIN